MKDLLPRCAVAFPLSAVLALLTCPFAAAATRSQTLALHAGWNSVHLQVNPTNAFASALFSNTPVAIAATYIAVDRQVDYLEDPAAISFKQEGWAVWYAPNRPDGFLSSLVCVLGNRSYLIYCKQDFTWTVTGNVVFVPVRWKSDSFNHVGFCLDGQAPPTFEKFFAGSAAHSPGRVYRLVDGQWTLVSDPVRTPMRSGEACWVYCRGASDYQGPLLVKPPVGEGVVFRDSGEAGILICNQSADPMDVQVETVEQGGPVPLAYTLRGIVDGRMDYVRYPLPSIYSLPKLEPGQTSSLWLKLRREDMTSPVQRGLLKISTGSGVQLWLPVTGTRPDLAANP